MKIPRGPNKEIKKNSIRNKAIKFQNTIGTLLNFLSTFVITFSVPKNKKGEDEEEKQKKNIIDDIYLIKVEAKKSWISPADLVGEVFERVLRFLQAIVRF